MIFIDIYLTNNHCLKQNIQLVKIIYLTRFVCSLTLSFTHIGHFAGTGTIKLWIQWHNFEKYRKMGRMNPLLAENKTNITKENNQVIYAVNLWIWNMMHWVNNRTHRGYKKLQNEFNGFHPTRYTWNKCLITSLLSICFIEFTVMQQRRIAEAF